MPRLYISGTPSGSDRFLEEEARRTHHRLFSLHGNYLNSVLRWIDKAQTYDKLPETILLDSGAFTAWNQGHKTTIAEVKKAYSQFFKATEGMFKEVWAINLDVIPGKRGVDPTQEQIETAVRESDENFKILQDTYGARILPVFHQGEDGERLDEVIEQAQFICVSPRNDLAEVRRARWAQEVHAHTKGHFTHGLATTGMIMLTVPWFSVDSATSIHVAAFGQLIFNIDGRLKKIFITHDSDKHKTVDKHIDTLIPFLQQQCTSLIDQDIFTIQELRLYVKARVLFNIAQLTRFTEDIRTQYNEQQSFFGV